MTDQNIPNRNRRKYLITLGSATFGLAGCLGGGGGDGEDGGGGASPSPTPTGTPTSQTQSYHIGISDFTSKSTAMTSIDRGGEWWLEDMGHQASLKQADGTASQQLSDIRNLLRQDIDALIITAGDSDAMAQGAKDAADQDIPVFGSAIPTNSEEIIFYTGISQETYARVAGEKLVETVRNQRSDPPFQILEMMFDQKISNAAKRHNFFNETLAEHDDFEITKQIQAEGFSLESAQSQLEAYLQSDPEIDGVFSSWAHGGRAPVNAFRKVDRLSPRGEPDHIPIVTMDGGPVVADYIKEGWIDFAIDQPMQFYTAAAAKYLVDYLDAGNDPSVLPSPGDEITADDVTFRTGGKHNGVDPWPRPIWAPARVEEFVSIHGNNLGFPFMQMSFPVISEDNADEPYWWFNLLE